MSAREHLSAFATIGAARLLPADSRQLAVLGSIDSYDCILQDHLWFKDGFDDDTQLVVLSSLEQCVDANTASSLLYGQQPSMLLVGKMEDRQNILTAMSRIRNHLTTLGKFALLLFMDREDDVPGQTFLSKGGALSAVRVQCARSATIWASGRTRDPYFEILGAPRGIVVTPSGGFDF